MSEEYIFSQKVMFQGCEVIVGQEIKVPQHKIVNVMGDELLIDCPSTTAYIDFTGGVPKVVPIANCMGKKEQKCFKTWKE